MPYKIYISTTEPQDRVQHVAIIKRALFSINEIPITAADVSDEKESAAYSLETTRQLIDQCDLFISIHGKVYGAVAPGTTQSTAEQEYHYAVSQNKTIFVFMPQNNYAESDERQQMLLQHIMERHVVTQFVNNVDLAAKVKLTIANYKSTRKTMQLRPAATMGFTENIQPTMAGADNFEALVNRALGIAQDDIEQIVRRAIELHEAQNQLQAHEPQKGLYVEDERDGQVLARPIWGEPLRRSQFQSDIFMIMPFRERFNTVYDNSIRPVVADLNLTIKRGDDFNTIQGAIIAEVWAAIYGCKLVIVETTEINANVYYELGMAHMLGKPAILLTQTREVEQLPFDIRHLRFLVYEDSITGKEQLTKDLRKSIVWILNDLKEQQAE